MSTNKDKLLQRLPNFIEKGENEQLIRIQYTGSGSAATLSIVLVSDIKYLQTVCTGAVVDNLNINLENTTYDTLYELITQITATGKYTATMISGISNDTASKRLEIQAVADIKTSAQILIGQTALDDIMDTIGNELNDVDDNNTLLRAAITIDSSTSADLDNIAYKYFLNRYYDETDAQLRERIKEAIDFWKNAGTLYSIIETARRTEGVSDAMYYNTHVHTCQAMNITYTGTGTSASLSITSGHLLTTSIVGGPGSENLVVDLTNASYDTLNELISYINAFAGGVYTASLEAGVDGDTQMSEWLQTIANKDILNPTVLKIGGCFLMDLLIFFDYTTYTEAIIETNLQITFKDIFPSHITRCTDFYRPTFTDFIE